MASSKGDTLTSREVRRLTSDIHRNISRWATRIVPTLTPGRARLDPSARDGEVATDAAGGPKGVLWGEPGREPSAPSRADVGHVAACPA